MFASLLLGLLFPYCAPVPDWRPKELTVALLVGKWEYEYGSYKEGHIILKPDKTYWAMHSPDSRSVYYGTWEPDGSTLTLKEHTACLDDLWAGGHHCAVYKFTFDLKQWPTLEGTTFNGNTQVALRRKQPLCK